MPTEQGETTNTTDAETETERLRVVVAEDETLIRVDIVEILTGQSYDVVGEADNGQKALELATELEPDVVLMDVKMPIMDGITAAEHIARDKIAPVVLLTAFSQRELVERAREAGAMAYVVKPFNENDLVPAIELAVARFDELRALEEEVSDLAEQFATRKLVDRAKSLLTTTLDLSEPEAFRWIQKTSMDRRLSMREVAQTVVDQMG
ncbi:response regulator [Cellulosimicrobium funkei]|nr:response regulator [Cellulosimicrobium funkei]